MTFTEIPADNLVPIFATEFDNSNAIKGGAMPWKNLIIGQPLSTKGEYNGTLVQITSDEQADAYFGAGSQLALMIRAFRKNSKNIDLWVLPVADDGDGVKATGTITCTVAGLNGLAAAGVIRLMIAGQSVPVTVLPGDASADVATKVAAAVNAKSNLPVTASVATNVVTLTAKNAGSLGNQIDVRYNHYQGEELPVGLTLAVVAMASGATDADYDADEDYVGKIIEGTWFNTIVSGSAESGNIAYIKDLLDERWTATVQQTGVCLFSINGELSTFTTKGNALNSQVLLLPSLPKSPTPGFEVAAAVCGCIAPIALNDAAAPLTNYAVKGIVAPKPEDRLGLANNNLLLKAGCALLVSGNDGTVFLKRMVTTYKTTPAGASDTSYQQVETVFTLSYLRWDWNNYMAGKYPHAKLADDGNDFGPGQVVMTPKLGAGELLSRYEYWMSKALVMNFDSFKENLVVMRDPDDRTALQFLIPAELISQFFIAKSKLQFK